ncbi:hypothetical protein ACFYNY_32070 [Streptomyces sp. NPDC006530]|uniref:hypothetical protein n=1 Tax=Streptomyces sp. NPDC006530 TaxID=3364750 RepID=UPI0036A8A612
MSHQGRRNRAKGETKNALGADGDSGSRQAEGDADRARSKVKQARADIEGRPRTAGGRAKRAAKER